MSQIRDRLQFFRQQMAAFEGSADPRRAIESGYYVEQPGKSLAESIAARIALRPSSTHLLVGSIGSGKTTQLLRACDRLNEIEDISAYYVDVSSYTDIPVPLIQPGVLIAISGVILSELMKDSQVQEIQKCREQIRNYAYGYLEHKPISSAIDSQHNSGISRLLTSPPPSTTPPIYTETIKHEGVLNVKSEIYQKQQEMLRAIKQLNEAVRKRNGNIILLFDGLDRLYNYQKFLGLISQDLQAISKIEIGSIVVGSLTITDFERNTLSQIVSTINYKFHFDIENDSDSYNFFEEVIKKRSLRDFICPGAMEKLIYFSGGVLRDLINLTQAAIEETYLSDSDHLEKIHVASAVESMGRAKILGLSDFGITTLKELLTGSEFIPRTDEDIKLLMTQRILEYQYPKRRYAVHPVIRDLIKEINIVHDNAK